MDPVKLKIVRVALASRLFVWALAVIADTLVPNHDAGVFLWTVTPVIKVPTWGDRFVSWIADGLTRWDGQHFLHIVNNGYTYESSLAFFPGYPIVVKVAAEVLYWLQVDYGLVHFHSAIKLAAVLVNGGFFVLAALALYDLTRKLFRDEYLAYKSALLFCINPASIFFSAAYSEAVYAAVSFTLMTKLEKGFSFKVGLLLAVAGFCRSNALLNLGFIAYKSAKMIVGEIAMYSWLKKMGKHELSTTVANIIGDALFPGFFSCLACIGPFALYQWYGFTQYCGLTKASLDYDQAVIDYARNFSLKLPSEVPSEWCSYKLPIPYSYIQSHYWNVGFLSYFHWRQIPNFALATPIIALVLWQSCRFLTHHKNYCRALGLVAATPVGLDRSGKGQKSSCSTTTSSHHLPTNFDTYGEARALPKECFVYVAHATFLALFAFFCINVQVTTRLLASSTPVIYWWMAVLTTPKDKKPEHKTTEQGSSSSSRLDLLAKLETPENLMSAWKNLVIDERTTMPKEGVWLLNYSISYACIGTLLFVNFLPWT